MNRRLRVRHRWITTLLALVVPLIFAAGLASRPQLLRTDSLSELGGSEPGYTMLVAERIAVSLEDALLDLRLYRGETDQDRYALEVSSDRERPLKGADVLVYWSAVADLPTSTPPADAYLLGTLAGPQSRRFELPRSARPGIGYLVFYSLAEQRLFEGTLAMPGPGDRT